MFTRFRDSIRTKHLVGPNLSGSARSQRYNSARLKYLGWRNSEIKKFVGPEAPVAWSPDLIEVVAGCHMESGKRRIIL